MIPTRLKISLIIAIVVFFVIVLYLLKKRRLTLKYTLLWLLTGVVMLIFVIFPELMVGIAGLLGIQTVMNTLYLLLMAFVMILLMMLTSIVSKQTERIGYLAQSNAMLEKRVRELEEQVKAGGTEPGKSGGCAENAEDNSAEKRAEDVADTECRNTDAGRETEGGTDRS